MTSIQGWEGQSAIISGGAAGLGLALAQRLTDLGVRTAILDRNPAALEAARERLGETCSAHLVDVTSEESVNAAVADVLARTGRIDILVNCAGIAGKTNIQSHQIDLADFDRVMSVNARGSLITSRAVLPFMLEKGYGRILHVA